MNTENNSIIYWLHHIFSDDVVVEEPIEPVNLYQKIDYSGAYEPAPDIGFDNEFSKLGLVTDVVKGLANQGAQFVFTAISCRHLLIVCSHCLFSNLQIMQVNSNDILSDLIAQFTNWLICPRNYIHIHRLPHPYSSPEGSHSSTFEWRESGYGRVYRIR